MQKKKCRALNRTRKKNKCVVAHAATTL